MILGWMSATLAKMYFGDIMTPHPHLTNATIFTGRGADIVYLNYDAPDPCWPFDGNLSMKFEVAATKGREYVMDNFGLSTEDITTIEV